MKRESRVQEAREGGLAGCPRKRPPSPSQVPLSCWPGSLGEAEVPWTRRAWWAPYTEMSREPHGMRTNLARSGCQMPGGSAQSLESIFRHQVLHWGRSQRTPRDASPRSPNSSRRVPGFCPMHPSRQETLSVIGVCRGAMERPSQPGS